MDINLGSKLAFGIESALRDLREEGGLVYTALVASSGTIVASDGKAPGRASDEDIAALACGAIFSLRALGERLGQSEDEGILKEDSTHPFYLHPLHHDFLLLAIGGERGEPGLVRLASRRALPHLVGLAVRIGEEGGADDPESGPPGPVSWSGFGKAGEAAGRGAQPETPNPFGSVFSEVLMGEDRG